MKILMGISHGVEQLNEEHLKRVKNEVERISPKKVGLELPEDYLKREENGVKTLFFDELASYIRSKGMEAVFLENPELWNRHHAIENALAVREGKVTQEWLEGKLGRLKERLNPYTAPELFYGLLLFKERYEQALKILSKAKTLPAMKRIWEKSIEDREKYVLKQIKNNDLDMIVLGDGHANKIKDNLPNYDYVGFMHN